MGSAMEMAEEEITASFKPWAKKSVYAPRMADDLTSLQDQENVNPFSPAFKAGLSKGKEVTHSDEDEEENGAKDEEDDDTGV